MSTSTGGAAASAGQSAARAAAARGRTVAGDDIAPGAPGSAGCGPAGSGSADTGRLPLQRPTPDGPERAAPGRRGRVLLLSGSLGMGHEVMAEACAASLARRGLQPRIVDTLGMMDGRNGALGQTAFRGLISVPGLYDAVHFSQLRTGGPVARLIETTSSRFLVPRLREHLAADPADLVISVFAAGAAAVSRLKPEFPGMATMVFSTDCCPHRIWVHDNTDLFLVTSETAARYVRRFSPRARVAVVPTPVRAPFYDPPTQEAARASLGIPPDARCVLLMSGAWGLGPLVEAAAALAAAGVWVLAVAGRNARLAARLAALAERQPRVVPFGFTDRIPELMAASDLVVTSSGDTCSEARVIGRDLLLLDVVPGHGRDNLQRELDRGNAEVTSTDSESLVRSALACLERVKPPSQRVAMGPEAWEQAFGAALAQVGIDADW